MIWHRYRLKQPSLFGPACCGPEATTCDRARKAWLCVECAGLTLRWEVQPTFVYVIKSVVLEVGGYECRNSRFS